MKNFLFAFIVFLLYSVFGMWYYSCVVKGLCDNENVSSPIESTQQPINENNTTTENLSAAETSESSNNKLVIDEGTSRSIAEFTSNLVINNKEGSITFPASTENFKTTIFKYLNENQDHELVIKGFHNYNENRAIGIERANEIKAILEDFGINEDKLSVLVEQKAYQYDTSGSYQGGIELELKELSSERLSEIESGIANKTLYSGFASKQFRADNTLQAYAIELRNYLNKYPGKTATITGHTDSVGDDIANDWFGMERAKNVRKYLVSQGIDASRLTALSKGENEPIDTNGTLEGRRKNRRIEIKVN